MTRDIDPLKALQLLERAAQAGDPRAKAELKKLQIAFLSAAAPTILGDDGDEIDSDIAIGAGALDYNRGDNLEIADRLLSGPLQHVDSLEAKAILMRHREAAQAKVAPWSNSNPPSASGAILGNQITLLPDAPEVEVARWTGADEVETGPVTVTLGYVQLNSLQTPGAIFAGQLRPIARVVWGTRGMVFTADIDLGTGAQLTITASTVSVRMLMPSKAGTTPGASIVCSAMISFKQCVRTAPLTNTVYVDGLAGGGTQSADIAIPAFAKGVRIWRSAPGNAIRFIINGLGGNQTTAFSIPASTDANAEAVPPAFFELPGNSTTFSILNSGAGATDIMAVFELEI